jgi:hypothetical protein
MHYSRHKRAVSDKLGGVTEITCFPSPFETRRIGSAPQLPTISVIAASAAQTGSAHFRRHFRNREKLAPKRFRQKSAGRVTPYPL